MSMLTHIEVGQYSVRGASLGGLYTAFHIPQVDSLFDVGLAIREGATASNLFLSHAHLDHLGALPSLLGMRGMIGAQDRPLKIFCPQGVESALTETLAQLSILHQWPLEVQFIPMNVGDEQQLRKDLWVRALKTFHPVPSLGFLLFDRVSKLRAEYRGLEGRQIKALKDSGVHIHDQVERPKIAYLTDTLPDALKYCPEVFDAEVLIIECTFLTDKKGVDVARAGCHIHLDELEPWAHQMKNKAVILMHFSQLHRPHDIVKLCQQRLSPILGDRLHLCLPPGNTNQWWI
jgi:ribonuclease Z